MMVKKKKTKKETKQKEDKSKYAGYESVKHMYINDFGDLIKSNPSLDLKRKQNKTNFKAMKKTLANEIKKNITKSPKARLPSHSGIKIIKDLANEQGALVREVPNPYADPVQDNRSLFFNKEFQYERRKRFGGFI